MRITGVHFKKNRPISEDVIEIIGEFGTYTLSDSQIETMLIEEGQMCEDCLDEGIVVKDEPVYPGEPHMAPVGEQVCNCKK